MCGERKECVVVPVGTKGPRGANPFPDRSAEELLNDIYLLIVGTCEALDSPDYATVPMELRLNLTASQVMAGIKLEMVMRQLGYQIHEA
jgi:hypothetical protein